MKLLCKKIKSHRCLEIVQSTNDTTTDRSRTFQKPKNAEEERKLIATGIPKSTIPLKKYSLKRIFLEWPNGRYINKNPVLEPCVFITGKS